MKIEAFTWKGLIQWTETGAWQGTLGAQVLMQMEEVWKGGRLIGELRKTTNQTKQVWVDYGSHQRSYIRKSVNTALWSKFLALSINVRDSGVLHEASLLVSGVTPSSSGHIVLGFCLTCSPVPIFHYVSLCFIKQNYFFSHPSYYAHFSYMVQSPHFQLSLPSL